MSGISDGGGMSGISDEEWFYLDSWELCMLLSSNNFDKMIAFTKS